MIPIEELFPSAMRSLKAVETRLMNTVPDEQWNEYLETLTYLQSRLQQLNMILHVEYTFSGRLIPDVENYTRELMECETNCAELLYYMLYRGQEINAADSHDKYTALFIEEVLNGIIENANIIDSLIVD